MRTFVALRCAEQRVERIPRADRATNNLWKKIEILKAKGNVMWWHFGSFVSLPSAKWYS